MDLSDHLSQMQTARWAERWNTWLPLRVEDAGDVLTIRAPTHPDLQVWATLHAMRATARCFATDALIGQLMRDLGLRGVAPTVVDRRMYDWLVAHVEFRADPKGVELVRTPRKLLRAVLRNERCACDCDEVATLAAGLLRAAFLPCALVAVGRDPTGPLEHVFAARITCDRRLVPLDAQERVPPGSWPEGIRRLLYVIV